MQLLASLGHPDKPYFPDPPSYFSKKMKSSSQLLHKERLWEGDVPKSDMSVLESYDLDVHPSKESDKSNDIEPTQIIWSE